MLDDDSSSGPLTISQQLADDSGGGQVIDLSQPWQPYPPQWQREPDESERLAAEAERQLGYGGEVSMLRGIALAVLALRAELKAGRVR